MSLYNKTAQELSKMLKTKECSATEITQDVLSRIRVAEPKVDAFITVTDEKALEQAKQIDKKIASGEELSELAGIPVAIKDNICTKDTLTTCASKILYNFVPPFNATVMDKLDNAGIVMTGKLNMDEFAMGSSCENSYFKKTKNPTDLERVPGGSSGGSAACVASYESVLALGSDTGGSIRQPASFCGVVGLKPTYGTVSRYGLIAFASSLDQIGPLGRSVYDVALMYSHICGHDLKDATSLKKEYPSFEKNITNNVVGLKIGIPKEYFGDAIDPEVKASVLATVSQYEKAGAIIKQISLPSTHYALSAYYIISSAEASSNLARFDGIKYGYIAEDYTSLINLYEKSRSEGFGDEVKRRIMLGTFVLSSGYYDAYYKKAKLLQRRFAAEFDEAFKDCDVIMTPVAPDTAFKIGENSDDPLKMYAGDICTVTVNIASLPAISIPCGVDKAGLPVGLQIIGPKLSEQLLLNTASFFEASIGGFKMKPVI